VNSFLATVPFDLYELQLFELVASERSFTRAARKAGLTQSAVTRQVAGIENALNARLFDRTTRAVTLTPAGQLLHERAGAILKEVSSTIEDVQRGIGAAPRALRLGVSLSIGFSYLPGFLFRFQREAPDVHVSLVQESSRSLLERLDDRDLDVAIVCTGRLPNGVEVAHRFVDEFTVIVPAQPATELKQGLRIQTLHRAVRGLRWLMIERQSTTGAQLHRWLERHHVKIEPAVEVNNFDLIVNMVSLGLGASIVPHRALPLYLQRRRLRRISLRPKFSRELAVVVRKTKYPKSEIEQFVKSILF
jgi:DNA-binding transcriptional LysR family regulator